MISDLGTSIETSDKILGNNIIRNYVCLTCGYKMALNVKWNKRKTKIPNQRCPNCKTGENNW